MRAAPEEEGSIRRDDRRKFDLISGIELNRVPDNIPHTPSTTNMAPSEKEGKIRLNHIAHVYYQHTNIEKQREFLADFVFTECKRVEKKTYYRGYGRDPFVYCAIEGDEDKFEGAGFVVESMEDLELAASTLPGASKIYDLTDAPGGGKCVTFHDPIDGFPMHLTHGQDEIDADVEPTFPKLDFNYVRVRALRMVGILTVSSSKPKEKTRSANRFQRLEKRPAPVHKLGHFGMVVTDFAKTCEFYTSRFNLKASDVGRVVRF